jgi:hypothetical protein
MSRILHPISLATAASAIGLGIAVSIAVAVTPGHPQLPGVGLDPTQAARDIEAARTAVSAPQTAYLADFNSGKRSATELPRADLDALVVAPGGFDDSVRAGSEVVAATVDSVAYHGSGMQDIPGATVTYRIERSFKGPVSTGATIQLDFLGGPYRQPTGEEIFLQVPLLPIDSVGDKVLLVMKQLDGGHWDLVDAGGKLKLLNGKVQGMPTYAGWTSEWTGRSEADLLAHVAAITK